MLIAFIPGNLGNDLTGTPGKGVVAKVDGEDITADEVRETARGMLQQQGAAVGRECFHPAAFFCATRRRPAGRPAGIGRRGPAPGVESHPQEIKDEFAAWPVFGNFLSPAETFIGEAEYEGLRCSRHNLTPATFEDSVGKGISDHQIAGADYCRCIGKRCGDSSGIRQAEYKGEVRNTCRLEAGG